MSETIDDAGESSPTSKLPATIELAFPIEFGGKTITQINMRRGTLGTLRGIKVSSVMPIDDLITIASRLSGQPVAVIERLDGEDAKEVIGHAANFYALCLTGGSTG